MSLVETIEKNVADTYGKGEESPQIESSIQRQSIMMMERQESVINHNRELFKEEDGVWRPILLTLGLLYKVQKIYDDTWYVNKENFCSDSEKIESLMNGLAKYWLYHFKVSQCIKTDIDGPTTGCYLTESECDSIAQEGGTECDLTLYTVWTGTDENGKVLASSKFRFSAFTGKQVMDQFRDGLDAFNNINFPWN